MTNSLELIVNYSHCSTVLCSTGIDLCADCCQLRIIDSQLSGQRLVVVCDGRGASANMVATVNVILLDCNRATREASLSLCECVCVSMCLDDKCENSELVNCVNNK